MIIFSSFCYIISSNQIHFFFCYSYTILIFERSIQQHIKIVSRKKLGQKLNHKLINFANFQYQRIEPNSPKFEAKLAYIFQSSGRGEGELSHYIIRKQFAYKYCIRGMAEVAASSQISARKSDEESDTINNLSIDDPPCVK